MPRLTYRGFFNCHHPRALPNLGLDADVVRLANGTNVDTRAEQFVAREAVQGVSKTVHAMQCK